METSLLIPFHIWEEASTVNPHVKQKDGKQGREGGLGSEKTIGTMTDMMLRPTSQCVTNLLSETVGAWHMEISFDRAKMVEIQLVMVLKLSLRSVRHM